MLLRRSLRRLGAVLLVFLVIGCGSGSESEIEEPAVYDPLPTEGPTSSSQEVIASPDEIE